MTKRVIRLYNARSRSESGGLMELLRCELIMEVSGVSGSSVVGERFATGFKKTGPVPSRRRGTAYGEDRSTKAVAFGCGDRSWPESIGPGYSAASIQLP